MPVVSALGSESDNPGSSPGQDKLSGGKKKIKALLLGLAKSMYYFDFISKKEWEGIEQIKISQFFFVSFRLHFPLVSLFLLVKGKL